MKLNWDDVKDIFESAALWENGHDMYWYRLMWGLMEYRGLNVYSNDEEVKTVFSRVFAIISIYHEFINICFDDDEDIAEAFSSSEYAYSIMRYLFNEKDVKDIFKALNEELGLVRTFYSIFITCVEFRDGKISYVEDEEFDNAPCGYDSEYNYDFDEDELYESALMFREYCSENEYFDEEEEYPDDPENALKQGDGMHQKSIREMNMLERQHYSLAAKVFRSTLLHCFILGLVALILGLAFYTIASARSASPLLALVWLISMLLGTEEDTVMPGNLPSSSASSFSRSGRSIVKTWIFCTPCPLSARNAFSSGTGERSSRIMRM